MTGSTRTRSTRLRVAVVLVAAAGPLLVACSGTSDSGAPSSPTAVASSASTATIGATSGATSGATGIPALPDGPTGPAHADPAAPVSSPPVRVRIPAIGVSSALQALGLQKDGALETPTRWQVAGWYAGGVRPGDKGPAVIAGHVDSVNGPAVFFELEKLRPGDAVYVTRANGSTVRFRVDSTAEYPKRVFPTEAVYGPSPVPTLRLVTCAGDFDRAERSYVDNLVVTAYAG